MGMYFYKNQLDLHLYGFLIMFYIFAHSSLFYQIVENHPHYFRWLPDSLKNPPQIPKNKKVTFADDQMDADSDDNRTETDSVYIDDNSTVNGDNESVAATENNEEDIQKIHQILYQTYGNNAGNQSSNEAEDLQEQVHVHTQAPLPNMGETMAQGVEVDQRSNTNIQIDIHPMRK
jgi:hypothetical protein